MMGPPPRGGSSRRDTYPRHDRRKLPPTWDRSTGCHPHDAMRYGARQVLNSADFAVPQSRKRVYAFGYRDIRCAGKVLPFTECNPQTLKQVIGGNQGQRVYDIDCLSCTLAANAGGQGGKTGMYIDMNENPCITCLARCIKSRYNSGITNRRGENSAILECYMPCLTPNRLHKRQQGQRFRPDGCPMFTLTACDIHGILMGCRIRKLMPKECLRLQGFADEQIDRMLPALRHQATHFLQVRYMHPYKQMRALSK